APSPRPVTRARRSWCAPRPGPACRSRSSPRGAAAPGSAPGAGSPEVARTPGGRRPSPRGARARPPGLRATRRDRGAGGHRRHRRRSAARHRLAWLADARDRRARRSLARRQSLADLEARPACAAPPRTSGCTAPRSPLPRARRRAGRRLRVADGRWRVGAPARGSARPHPRSHVRRQGLRLSCASCTVEHATCGFLAYVCDARPSAGVRAMTAFPTVELTVYPYDCDAFGHLNQAALLTLLERARWEALARGPGMDLFDRNGVWPAARKAVIEYKAGAFPRDVLRIERTVVHRCTTCLRPRRVGQRVADDALIAEAEIVFVCIDRVGRATPI